MQGLESGAEPHVAHAKPCVHDESEFAPGSEISGCSLNDPRRFGGGTGLGIAEGGNWYKTENASS